MIKYSSWLEIDYIIENLIDQIKLDKKKYNLIISLNRGGLVPGVLVSSMLGVGHGVMTASSYAGTRQGKLLIDDRISMIGDIRPNDRILLVDDIADTGSTFRAAIAILGLKNIDTLAVLLKNRSTFKPTYSGGIIPDDTYIKFPWEKESLS